MPHGRGCRTHRSGPSLLLAQQQQRRRQALAAVVWRGVRIIPSSSSSGVQRQRLRELLQRGWRRGERGGPGQGRGFGRWGRERVAGAQGVRQQRGQGQQLVLLSVQPSLT